jgi:integrase
MPIYKRHFKTGVKWCVYVRLPNGKRYRKVIGTKKKAEQIQKKLESEVIEGKWEIRDKDEISFKDLLERYLEYMQANKAKSTVYCDTYRIKAHLLPYFGDTPIQFITAQMIDDYKSMRINADASPNTVNHELVNLSHMLRMAVRWKYIDRNVVSDVERMKIAKKSPRYLSQDEVCRLLEAARESYIYPLIVTALHTGMRKGELLNLTWSDINFDQRMITIQSRSDWHTKNYKPRSWFLTPVLYEVLKDHRQFHIESGIENDYVFTYNGNRIKTDIPESLRTVVTKAGLKGVTLHTLRHTFASQLVMAGVPLRDVQELMGHQSFQTTLQYAHLSEEHVKKQVLKLPFANG